MSYNSSYLAMLLRRIDRIAHEYDVIGLELKDRRIALAKTLASLSENLCSISYISKIENCKIRANKKFLREICHRVDLDDKQIDILFNLKGILEEVVFAYLNEDYDFIKEKYQEANGLCNYRYSILEMIYFLSQNDLAAANKSVLKLMKISGSMFDYDLVVFSTFSAIISYYNKNYKEAKETFDALRKYKPDEDISLIVDKYSFLTMFALNSTGCISEYNKVKNGLISRGYYKQLDAINYVFCIYLYRNNELIQYKNVYKSIQNKAYKKCLIYQLRDNLDVNIAVPEEWIKSFDSCTLALYYVKNDKEKAYSILKGLSNNQLTFNFDFLYYSYQLLVTDEEKYNFISNKILSKLEMTREGYWIDYFLKELAILSDRVGKYKIFTSAYRALRC